MKTFINKIIALTVFLSALLPASAYDFMVDGLAYDVLSLDTLTCGVAKSDQGYQGKITIPEKVTYKGREFQVISLSYGCFLYSKLTAITFPNTIQSIGEDAFSFSTLSEIKIPASVTELGDDCFSGCKSLVSVEIPSESKLRQMPSGCFSGCSNLKSINFECDVYHLGYNCFSGCTSLESVNLPDAREIGEKCFAGSESLKEIDLPRCSSFGEYCFRNCGNLSEIDLGKATYFGYNIFTDCTNLKSLILPGTLTSIWVWNPNQVADDEFPKTLKTLTIKKPADNPTDELSIYYYEKYGSGEKSYRGAFNCPALEYLDINRQVSCGSLYCPNLKILSFDLSVDMVCQALGYRIGWCTQLECMHVKSLEPEPFDKDCFSAKQYMDLQVIVPDSSVDAYKQDASWKNFWNIMSESEYRAGIREVAADSEKVEVARYDMQGRPVSENYTGVMIIKYSDGTTKKVSRL